MKRRIFGEPALEVDPQCLPTVDPSLGSTRASGERRDEADVGAIVGHDPVEVMGIPRLNPFVLEFSGLISREVQ
jgi:hypothetical protein